MEPENPWPTPPPPLMPDDGAETIETRYMAREVDPRYPPHEVREVIERYPTPGVVSSTEVARTRRVYALARAGQIAYLILGILETLLVIRFVLKLLAANPVAPFTSFIYALTEPFVVPFEGVFQTPQTQGAMLDLAAVLAMIVYALVVWGIVSVLYTLGNRRPA
ncbi:MAG TPA: YggT family protein [Ktedonobacterales bacterium]|nr:YggT family protein [Ktedonobacterales bacterium]